MSHFDSTLVLLNHAQQLLRGLPDDYTVFDLETTGFKFGVELVVEVGYAVVRGRQVVDSGGCVLDWTQDRSVDLGWLAARLDDVKYRVEHKKNGEPSGRHYRFTMDVLQTEGSAPRVVLSEFGGLLRDCVHRGELTIGHNAWHFDRNMLNANLRRFVPELVIPWQENSIFDTGLTEMASQKGARGIPWPEDTLAQFYHRIQGRGGPISWALDTHCVPKYGLDRKYNLDTSRAHANPWDCLATHYLFEHWRELKEAYRRAKD